MSELGDAGARRIEWARDHMPVLAAIRDELKQKKTIRGLRIGMALHVEAKTGVLALSLREAGATIRLASCNPLSTDDSVATALAETYGLEVYAKKWQTNEEYYANLYKVLDLKPDLVIDDGADLVNLLHTKRKELLAGVRGANEETTTGIIRLRAMERDGALRFPVIDVNDARMKHLFDNRYGTGKSTFDGLMNATNLLIAGKTFVVAGYGWTGRGIAMRARGMGARVVVTEVDSVKAIEASMDGFEVLAMRSAVREADFIVSATGCKDIVTAAHFAAMKDGVVLANAGHFDNEISKADLEKTAKGKRRVREFVDEYALPGGKRAYLVAEGRLVNITAGQGHPVEIMDMSFAIQAVSAGYLAENAGRLHPRVYPVPPALDLKVARLKLRSTGIRIDHLTKAQRAYLESWQEGTRRLGSPRGRWSDAEQEGRPFRFRWDDHPDRRGGGNSRHVRAFGVAGNRRALPRPENRNARVYGPSIRVGSGPPGRVVAVRRSSGRDRRDVPRLRRLLQAAGVRPRDRQRRPRLLCAASAPEMGRPGPGPNEPCDFRRRSCTNRVSMGGRNVHVMRHMQIAAPLRTPGPGVPNRVHRKRTFRYLSCHRSRPRFRKVGTGGAVPRGGN